MKTQKPSAKTLHYIEYFQANFPRNPQEILQKVNSFNEILLFLDNIIDMQTLHCELPKKPWFSMIPDLISLFLAKSFENQVKIVKIHPKTFFLSDFDEEKPFFLNKTDVFLVLFLKKLNKLAKTGIFTEESQFLPFSFLEPKMRQLLDFIQEMKLLKPEFRLQKKSQKTREIKENLNFYYKAFFKHIFLKVAFYLNVFERNFKENIWGFLLKVLILYENFELSLSVFELFPLIIQSLARKPEELAQSFRKIEKFRSFIEKERENLRFIYFSKKIAKSFIEKKKPLKILVFNVKSPHFNNFFFILD